MKIFQKDMLGTIQQSKLQLIYFDEKLLCALDGEETFGDPSDPNPLFISESDYKKIRSLENCERSAGSGSSLVHSTERTRMAPTEHMENCTAVATVATHEPSAFHASGSVPSSHANMAAPRAAMHVVAADVTASREAAWSDAPRGAERGQ